MRVRSLVFLPAGLLALGAALVFPTFAAEGPWGSRGGSGTYGQHLVDRALALNPGVLVLALHVTPPKASENVIVASNIGRIGKPADEDDVAVIKTGKSKHEVNAAGDRFEVEETLNDVSGVTVGAIGVVFPYTMGQDTHREQQVAADIQAFFQRHVMSEANLLDPYPYSSEFSPDNAAQALVDKTLARHPELLLLGMHVSLTGRGNYMLGSNIGRIGKKADDDDMRVVNTGKSNLDVSENGKRYHVELVLKDSAGRSVGALATAFRYKAGDDKAALNSLAEAIRDELAREIPAAEALTTRPAPLTLAGETKLPDYTGDFDHFAADTSTGKLYLAGEDGAALEVFDLRNGALLKSIKGYGVPHSVFILPDTNELLVIDAKRPSQVLDAKTLAVKRTIDLPAGADSAAYDPSTKHLWIVTGGKDVPQPDSNLLEIDPASGKVFHNINFVEDHVEALALEEHGDRLFINITGQQTMAVIDKRTGNVLARWPIKEAQQNAPVAFDESNHRLFVVTRKPGMLLVLDSMTGATVAKFKGPGRADQVVWDAANRRIYVTGGEGYIGVFAQDDADHYSEAAHVPSAPGAKTAILVPSLNRLYVAASPGEAKGGGALLCFDVTARP